jgi:hypothetical protein
MPSGKIKRALVKIMFCDVANLQGASRSVGVKPMLKHERRMAKYTRNPDDEGAGLQCFVI